MGGERKADGEPDESGDWPYERTDPPSTPCPAGNLEQLLARERRWARKALRSRIYHGAGGSNALKMGRWLGPRIRDAHSFAAGPVFRTRIGAHELLRPLTTFFISWTPNAAVHGRARLAGKRSHV